MPRDTLAPIAASEQGTDPIEEFAPRERVTKEVSDNLDEILSSGWSSDKSGPKYSSGPARFTVPDDGTEVLIKFLEDKPFTSFYQHWIPTDVGKRPFACLVRECPLCNRGDRAKSVDYLNVIEIGDDGHDLKLWMASPDPSAAIKEKMASKRSSPINREDLYFLVSKRAGSNGVPSYTVDVIKEADLGEVGKTALTPAEIASYSTKLWTRDVAKNQVKSRDELKLLASRFLKD